MVARKLSALSLFAGLVLTLAANPAVEVWQATGTAPILLNLTYDAGRARYTGQVNLDPVGGTHGHVRLQVSDTAGHTVVALTPFHMQTVPRAELAEVLSDDSLVRLVIPPNTLSNDAVVSIQQTGSGSLGQGRLMRVGPAYQVSTSTGEEALNGSAFLYMYYDLDMDRVLTSTLRIHRWDAGGQTWVPLASTVDGAMSMVRAEVNHLSVFALFGEAAPAQRLHLPVVVKRF